MADQTSRRAPSTARRLPRRLLCLIPSVRRWFAEVDELASDRRRWRAEQARTIGGSKAEHDAILTLLSYLTPRQPVGFDKVRLGRDGDGGYVLLDDFIDVSAALSFGIETDCSWDTCIAERGIDVYQYDHSVDNPPEANTRFRFFKKKIAATPSDHSETLGSALAKLPVQSARKVILKIDIEGSEWEVFDTATIEDLARFSQIVGEFHGFSNVLDSAWRETACRVMLKLHSVFEVVHIHGNNHAPLYVISNIAIPESIELTFANRAIYACQESNAVFPTPIDQPNREECPDIFLGSARFK